MKYFEIKDEEIRNFIRFELFYSFFLGDYSILIVYSIVHSANQHMVLISYQHIIITLQTGPFALIFAIE